MCPYASGGVAVSLASDDRRLDDLALAAKWGNPGAFSEVFEVLYPRVYAFLWRQLGSVDDCEEIAAETFAAVCKGLKGFEPAFDGALKAWVFRIARHRLIDRLRRTYARSEELRDPSALIASESADSGESFDFDAAVFPIGEALASAVAELPESQRSCLLLRFVADMSIEQVAEAMERSPNAIKQLQHRALEGLRANPGIGKLRGDP